jgi:hypothetical protein
MIALETTDAEAVTNARRSGGGVLQFHAVLYAVDSATAELAWHLIDEGAVAFLCKSSPQVHFVLDTVHLVPSRVRLWVDEVVE